MTCYGSVRESVARQASGAYEGIVAGRDTQGWGADRVKDSRIDLSLPDAGASRLALVERLAGSVHAVVDEEEDRTERMSRLERRGTHQMKVPSSVAETNACVR